MIFTFYIITNGIVNWSMRYTGMWFYISGVELTFFSGVYGTCLSNTLHFGEEAKGLIGISGMFIGAGEIIGKYRNSYDKFFFYSKPCQCCSWMQTQDKVQRVGEGKRAHIRTWRCLDAFEACIMVTQFQEFQTTNLCFEHCFQFLKSFWTT